jgi:hypothetical protein
MVDSRHLITLFEEGRAEELAQTVGAIADDRDALESMQAGLLEIAKSETRFEDLETRRLAISIMDMVGLTKRLEVRRELYNLFDSFFDERKLTQLAAFATLPKGKRCGPQCAEMRLLRFLIIALLRVREEPGITAGRLVIEIFHGTDYAKRVTNLMK